MKLITRNRLRKISQALYEGGEVKGLTGSDADYANELKESAKSWLGASTLQGIGIGTKIIDGKDTQVPCIRVYVDKKIPIKQLEQPAPSKVQMGKSETIPIDVVEIGELKLQMAQFAYKYRPLHSGLSIASSSRSAGTLGLIVAGKPPSTSRYILSNYHVLRPLSAQSNNEVWQQAKQDGGNSSSSVATFEREIPLIFDTDGLPNIADAAIAKLDSEASFSQSIPGIGPVKGISGVVRTGRYVQIVGRTSGRSRGKVIDPDYQTRLTYPGPNGETLSAGFKNLVLCEQFTQAGDSGALVLNTAKYAIGLHMAGSSTSSVFCRIKPVFDQLDIALIDS